MFPLIWESEKCAQLLELLPLESRSASGRRCESRRARLRHFIGPATGFGRSGPKERASRSGRAALGCHVESALRPRRAAVHRQGSGQGHPPANRPTTAHPRVRAPEYNEDRSGSACPCCAWPLLRLASLYCLLDGRNGARGQRQAYRSTGCDLRRRTRSDARSRRRSRPGPRERRADWSRWKRSHARSFCALALAFLHLPSLAQLRREQICPQHGVYANSRQVLRRRSSVNHGSPGNRQCFVTSAYVHCSIVYVLTVCCLRQSLIQVELQFFENAGQLHQSPPVPALLGRRRRARQQACARPAWRSSR